MIKSCLTICYIFIFYFVFYIFFFVKLINIKLLSVKIKALTFFILLSIFFSSVFKLNAQELIKNKTIAISDTSINKGNLNADTIKFTYSKIGVYLGLGFLSGLKIGLKANFSKHISTELLYGNNILLYIFNVADITIYGLKFNWQKNPYSKWYYGFGIYLDREVFGNYSNYFVDNNVSLFYLLIPTINRKIIIDKDNDFIISAGISAMFGQKVRGINEPYYTLLGIPELDFCYIFKF